jgi:hypothetical protein
MLGQQAENRALAFPGPMVPEAFKVVTTRQDTADTWALAWRRFVRRCCRCWRRVSARAG